MRWLFLLLILILVRGSTLAQSDTIYIQSGTVNKWYLTSQIDSITFGGFIPTGIKEGNAPSLSPTQFALYQNFPNPFNPTTKLQFQLPSSGKVRLNIYDISGRLIKEIFAGDKVAGKYTFEWNGNNTNGRHVASGVYFYSVQFNNSLLTKKMIYLK